MARKSVRGITTIPCKNCRIKINLNDAANMAEAKNSSEIRCPHCNSYLGKLN